jgi:hypothetical protein
MRKIEVTDINLLLNLGVIVGRSYSLKNVLRQRC